MGQLGFLSFFFFIEGMLKLLHNCTHLTQYQSNAKNSPSQASAVYEP